jgi:hypothetical protein
MSLLSLPFSEVRLLPTTSSLFKDDRELTMRERKAITIEDLTSVINKLTFILSL